MKLIVGLGNLGPQYENTRHNVGFLVIDELARRWGTGVNRRRFSGMVGTGHVGHQQVGLLKPATFVNRSGRSVREALTFYKMDIQDVLLVTDDLALPLGKLRLRPKGSAGGHNGLSSVIEELGQDLFARLRLGIGWVGGPGMVGHVLGTFTVEEAEQVTRAIQRAADAAECWITGGIDSAMNKFNRPDEEPGG